MLLSHFDSTMQTSKFISIFRYFSITTSCNMFVSSLYKLDDLLPTSITCIVTAKDSGGNTGTTTVVITIGKILYICFIFPHN